MVQPVACSTLHGFAATACARLRLSSNSARQLSWVAREAALDVSAACYRPEVAKYIAGVANHLADQLSKRIARNVVMSQRGLSRRR